MSHQQPDTSSPPLLSIDKLNACVHCGLCLPTCATYQATGSEAESPRGRLYLMRKWVEGSITDGSKIKPYLDHCLACHACETVCPSGVQYGDLLFQAREHLAAHDKSGKNVFKRFIFNSVLPNPSLLNTVQNSLRLYQQSGFQRVLRNTKVLRLIPGMANQESLLPTVPEQDLLKPGMRFGNVSDPLVALMTGCVMDTFFNPIHWQTIFVLTQNGYQVLIPEQTCCGALAHHAGETAIAKDLAAQNIQTVLKEIPEWIVLNSAGCGSTMQAYGRLLSGSDTKGSAELFASKVIDIMALLSAKPLAEFPEAEHPQQTLLYHAACHLYHVQKVRREPIDTLRQLPKTDVLPLDNIELCCGSAGIYNLEYPELADEMLDNKLDSVATTLRKTSRTDSITLVSGNPGCLMQLAKGLKERQMPLTLKHPVEVLAEAYGYQSTQDVKFMQQVDPLTL